MRRLSIATTHAFVLVYSKFDEVSLEKKTKVSFSFRRRQFGVVRGNSSHHRTNQRATDELRGDSDRRRWKQNRPNGRSRSERRTSPNDAERTRPVALPFCRMYGPRSRFDHRCLSQTAQSGAIISCAPVESDSSSQSERTAEEERIRRQVRQRFESQSIVDSSNLDEEETTGVQRETFHRQTRLSPLVNFPQSQ